MESVEHLYDGKVLRITASFGAASGEKTVDLNEALVKRADDALYRAKQGGRNRVCK
jgi:diguanylate cyclase (GGDEF)-like protein